ncbi:hypothetical protein ACHWQZ_G009529 [Mnemiopsis leidyi]
MLNHHFLIAVAFATLRLVKSSEDGDTGCLDHQHQCKSGRCIMNEWICDGHADCPDEDDEASCGEYMGPNVCSEGQLQCRNGNCISGNFRCDGVRDCADGIDEEGCNPPGCGEGKFSCRSGSPRCVSADWECDGQYDCDDQSDEQNCHNVTRSEDDCYGFSCDNNRCIHETRVCDGQNDCGDDSDEKRCTEGMCSPAEFRCGDGRCIEAGYQCDGVVDCDDNSDERGCDPTCDPLREISCIDGTCIPFEQSCDGEIHCPDASDEFNCGSVNCTADQFTCKRSGTCINRDWVCDYHSDCDDGSDELECAPITCEEGQFQCDARMCVPVEDRCDGVDDCANGADEEHCGNCSVTGKYQCENNKCISLTLLCDDSDDCGDSSDEINCYTRQCSEDEFLCNNGKCIDKTNLCDGQVDCFGSEDETDILCAVEECTHFRCGSGECVDNRWVCDGENDCADRSDEQDCDAPARLFGGCDGYTCMLTRQCISADKECDKNIDCFDGTDELHCGENECALGTHECSHGCVDAIIGYNCFCPAGYELAEDNRNCVDVDECSEVPELCEHFCSNNRGGYRCDCAAGYVLEDTTRCRLHGIREIPNLFYSTNEGISALGEHGQMDLVEERFNKITKFDVDTTHNIIIYYTTKTDIIQKFDMTTNYTTTLYENIDTDTLTVDHENSLIYWSDKRRRAIMRGDYSGSTAVQILDTADSLPHALDFSSKRGALFWGVSGRGIKMTTLENMVTTDVVVNLTDNHVISDIKVDDVLDRVYWTDPRNSQIHFLDRDSNLHVIERNVSYPVALATFENSLLYLDQHTAGIVSYDRLTGIKHPIPLTIPVNYFQVVINQEVADGMPDQDVVTCLPDEILCDGSCVIRDFICDGQKHCSDLTREEMGCDQPLTCGDMFKCADNNTCVPETWVCDGHRDCEDGSDETNSACHDTPCNLKTHFSSGRCVSRLWRCDGQTDCDDESDEANCTASNSCREGQLTCGDGACITDEMRCNGVFECEDGADERDCEMAEFCRQSQFTFTCDGTCIPDDWVCDGEIDCGNQQDERNCYMCPEGRAWSGEQSKCTDKTPCQLAGCQQMCNKGTCSCQEGYYLTEDGKTCLTPLSPVLLALVQLPQQSGLIQLDHVQLWGLGEDGGARSRAAELLSNALSLENVLALDFHYSLQKAVYADSTRRSVIVTPMSDNDDKVSPKEVFHFGDTTISDLVVDWVSDNIYWTNQTSHALMVGNMDGSVVVELLKLETTPHHLTMDPISGNLYWIGSVGAHTDIYTCSRSGAGVRPLFWRQFRAASLAVDTTTGVLYWYDSHHQAIFSNKGYGEKEFSTIARNISHAENLNYYNGILYWISETDEDSELVTFNVMTRDVANIRKLSRRPFKLRLFQEELQRVYNPKLLACRNNRGGCADLCFASSNQGPRECGCFHGINSMKMCMSEEPVCEPGSCGGDGWCSISYQNQTCSCGRGYHGDRCQLTSCKDTQESCPGNKICYHNSLSNMNHCCHDNAKGCSEIPKHISTQTITRPKNHYDYTTLITVGVAIAITLGILASAVGYRRWKRSRGRLRSSTLVDMYPMEPVQDDLRQEDDEPLLYD